MNLERCLCQPFYFFLIPLVKGDIFPENNHGDFYLNKKSENTAILFSDLYFNDTNTGRGRGKYGLLSKPSEHRF